MFSSVLFAHVINILFLTFHLTVFQMDNYLLQKNICIMLFKKKNISSPGSFFGMLSKGGCVNCDCMISQKQVQ